SCILVILRQSMAEIAPSLGIEQIPTAFGRVTDGICLSRDEMIEKRIKGGQRPFVRCNGAEHILLVYGPAEGLQEFGLVILVVRNPRHSITDGCRTHFEGIRDRQCRLLLERGDPPVPKLVFVIEGIQNGWGVALAVPSVKARTGSWHVAQ